MLLEVFNGATREFFHGVQADGCQYSAWQAKFHINSSSVRLLYWLDIGLIMNEIV